MLEERSIDTLRPHPEHEGIFGKPEEHPRYGTILESIHKHGIQEPLVVKPDGTLLAGHIRLACARELGLAAVPVRVAEAFASYFDEVSFLVRDNAVRRQPNAHEDRLTAAWLRAFERKEKHSAP